MAFEIIKLTYLLNVELLLPPTSTPSAFKAFYVDDVMIVHTNNIVILILCHSTSSLFVSFVFIVFVLLCLCVE